MIFLDFMLEYNCDTEQRGAKQGTFINSGQFPWYLLRGSAGMPHRFHKAKQESSGSF